jgi:hypothetical protein
MSHRLEYNVFYYTGGAPIMALSKRIQPIISHTLLCICILLVPSFVAAYSQYTVDDDATYCGSCHGDFRNGDYISAVDGQNWGSLHNLHRNTMLNGDCSTCHNGGYFPVELASSAGGDGLDAIGCMGCHGRAEDNVPGNPSYPSGAGAGLRQHHTNAGVSDCIECHADADPVNYTPVGESTLPPYYSNPGSGHPSMPTGSCNDDGTENFAGLAIGLDNDGDGSYDTEDPDCNVSGVAGDFLPLARLLQNHPNPFNPSTTIKYIVNTPGKVRLQVFSLNGNLVKTLVDGRHETAMTYQAVWNGRDEKGRPQPSGVFFYRLETTSGSEMKKMILLK